MIYPVLIGDRIFVTMEPKFDGHGTKLQTGIVFAVPTVTGTPSSPIVGDEVLFDPADAGYWTNADGHPLLALKYSSLIAVVTPAPPVVSGAPALAATTTTTTPK